MATTIDQAALQRLQAFLRDSRIVAFQARSTEIYSHNVLQSLLNRHQQYRLAHGPYRPLTFVEYTAVLQTVVRGIDISQLATETQTPEDHVDSIVAVVADSPNRNWGQHTVYNHVVNGGPNLRTLFAPIPRSIAPPGYIHWPESIPAHAYQLRQMTENLHRNHQTGHNISAQDIGVMAHGAALLDQKITLAFGNILDTIPPQTRPQFASESWYLNYQRYRDSPNWVAQYSLAANFAGMAPHFGHGNMAQGPNAPPPGHYYQPSATAPVTPFATRVMHPAGQDFNTAPPPTLKHTLARSPGKSPTKKKMRDASPTAAPEFAEQSTDLTTPYMFFVLAERDNLKDDLTEERSGLRGGVQEPEFTKLLSHVWITMSAQEKAPYEAAYELWEQQQHDERAAPEVEGNNEVIDELTQTNKRKALVHGIPRCATILSAADLCRGLRTYSQL